MIKKDKEICKNEPIEPDGARRGAFNLFKEHLTTPPVLALPTHDILYMINCHSSAYGIGVVLLQQKIL